ncbi:MAG: signal peptidase I [Planctomycetes bacterium]|nr:signal peptidase I [Planctomycetota bacterium]
MISKKKLIRLLRTAASRTIRNGIIVTILCTIYYFATYYRIDSLGVDNSEVASVTPNSWVVARKSVPVEEFVRGDVVELNIPEYVSDQNKLFLARIVGLPGDVIACDKGVWTVSGRQEGVTVDENLRFKSYANHIKSPNGLHFAPMTVPDGCIFVLVDDRGDTKLKARDSRFLGPLSVHIVTGYIDSND